jgi:hypothetical protein
MKLLSATDVAIAKAIKAGTLRSLRRTGRFGEFWAIEDDHGVIEVHNTDAEAFRRVTEIMAAL